MTVISRDLDCFSQSGFHLDHIQLKGNRALLHFQQVSLTILALFALF